jgi:hypothetical protein
MTSWLCGRRRAGKLTGLAGLCACNGWKCLIGKTPSPPSFGAPPTRPRPTNGRGASGRGLCGTRRRTSQIPRRWISSSAGRAASTRAPLGFLGAWAERLRPEPQKRECARLAVGGVGEDRLAVLRLQVPVGKAQNLKAAGSAVDQKLGRRSARSSTSSGVRTASSGWRGISSQKPRPGLLGRRTRCRRRVPVRLRRGPSKRMAPNRRAKCRQTRYPDPKPATLHETGASPHGWFGATGHSHTILPHPQREFQR